MSSAAAAGARANSRSEFARILATPQNCSKFREGSRVASAPHLPPPSVWLFSTVRRAHAAEIAVDPLEMLRLATPVPSRRALVRVPAAAN